MAIFEASVTLACAPEAVFDFLLTPDNHQKLSPPAVGLTFLNPPAVITAGSRLEFKVQAHGFVQQCLHEVTLIERPSKYVEVQVQGPLQKLEHTHLFERTASGQTVVTDRIEFEPPGGLIGLMVTAAKISDALESAYEHRYAKLEEIFGKGSA